MSLPGHNRIMRCGLQSCQVGQEGEEPKDALVLFTFYECPECGSQSEPEAAKILPKGWRPGPHWRGNGDDTQSPPPPGAQCA
ncbi:hypothetical protein TWF718_009114 [Orbilia javanica]|uniref:Uncharacterized protein n=1 Tax=Orbilia javanica TaxID=47235 RepID=A0AAN8MVJ6_9PEZI